MSRPWNPNDPTRVGLEFEPTSYGSRSLSADQAAIVQKMRARQADTIDQVWINNRCDRSGVLLFEVYLEGSEVATDVQTQLFLPTADAAQYAFTDPSFGSTNMYLLVNDANPRVPDAGADYLRGNGDDVSPGTASFYIARFGGLASALAGRRILAIRQIAMVQGFPGWPSPWAHLLYRTTGGVHVFPGQGQYVPNDSWTLLTKDVTYNPQTGFPFTVAELQAMGGTTGQCGFGVQFGYGSAGPSAAIIHSLGLEVVHCAENRVAWGGATIAVGAPNALWDPMPVKTPAGGTNFARSSGQDYTVVVRRRQEPDNVGPVYLGGVPEWGAPTPPAASGFESPTMLDGWAHYASARLHAYGYVEALGNPTMTVWPIIMRQVTGSLIAPDGQGYAKPKLSLVFGATTGRQQVTPTGAGTISVLRVGVRPATNGPIADLRLRLFRNADNVQIGGNATLTRDDWDDAAYAGFLSDRPIKYVNVAMASTGAVTGSTTYYILADSAGATGLSGINGVDAWEIVSLDATVAAAPTYLGGGTDQFLYPGTTTNAFVDWPAQMITAPTAPGSATLTTPTVFVGDDGTACAIPGGTLTVPRITWAATSLGVAFAYYEVQRREPTIDPTWYTIGRFTAETEIDAPNVPYWEDYEARRNVATEYRVRVVRTDGGFSAWRTATGSVTATLTGCQMLLTSALFRAVIARNDTGPRQWQFLNSDQVKRMRIYGADYHKAFTSLNQFGFTTQLDLIMYGKGDQFAPDATLKNWEAFGVLDTWNAIGVNPACLLTDAGQRVWGTLSLLEGRRHDSRADLYVARVEFTQSSAQAPIVERSDA